MAKKINKTVAVIGIVLFLLSIIGGVAIFSVQQTAFEQFKGNVGLPLTVSYDCQEIPEEIKSVSLEPKIGWFTTTPDEVSLYCGQQNMQGYYPSGCEYELKGLAQYQVCDANDVNCGKSLNYLSEVDEQQTKQVTITSSQKLFVKGYKDSGYTITPRPFRLVTQSPTQGKFIVEKEQGCTLISKGTLFQYEKDGKITNLDQYDLKPADKPISVVIGTIQVTGDLKNIIYHPITNKVVWVTDSPNGVVVCPTFDQDGQKFVNQLDCKKDAEIFCLPSNPACSDSGNEVVEKVGEGKACSNFGGVINGFVPVSANERCEVKCVDGKTSINQNNCKVIETSSAGCPSDRPFLSEGKCVTKLSKEILEKNTCASEGKVWQTEESVSCDLLCKIGLSEPVKVTNAFCEDKPTTTYIIIGLVALFGLLLFTQPKPQQAQDFINKGK